jgi:transcriptional accessory protein Tex/SPT6
MFIEPISEDEEFSVSLNKTVRARRPRRSSTSSGKARASKLHDIQTDVFKRPSERLKKLSIHEVRGNLMDLCERAPHPAKPVVMESPLFETRIHPSLKGLCEIT